MDKYLVKPTQLIGENGYVYDTNSLDQTPAIQELAKKVDNATFLNTTAIQEVRERVYQMEIVNGAVNDRIKAAEDVSAEAKTAANAAHTYASGLFERVTTAEKTANTAREKANEAYDSLHSLNGDYENLKSRVEDLEEIGGQGGADLVVGKSKMGYVPDFTEYGLNNQKYVYLEWGSEGRSLTFSSDTPLGDVLEEIIYYTGTAITSNHNRITALENGSSGGTSGGSSSGTTCNCPSDVGERLTALENKPSCSCPSDVESRLTALENNSGGSNGSSCNCPSDFDSAVKDVNISYARYAQVSDEKAEELGIDKTTMFTHPLEFIATHGLQLAVSNNYTLTDVKNKLSSHDNSITSHTNSIQSLDTRTGSHTASIGQLENRMTDVEVQATSNKTTITSIDTELDLLKTSIALTRDQFDDLKIRVETLESNSGTSGDGTSSGETTSSEDLTKINNKLDALKYNIGKTIMSLRSLFSAMNSDPLVVTNMTEQTLEQLNTTYTDIASYRTAINTAFTENS